MLLSETAASLFSSRDFQRVDERPGLRLTDSAAFIGTATADPILDRVQHCNPLQRLMRDRCRAALVDLDKSATPVRPAKGQRRWTAVALRIGQLLIDRVSVAMNDAGITRKAAGRCGSDQVAFRISLAAATARLEAGRRHKLKSASNPGETAGSELKAIQDEASNREETPCATFANKNSAQSLFGRFPNSQ